MVQRRFLVKFVDELKDIDKFAIAWFQLDGEPIQILNTQKTIQVQNCDQTPLC